MKDQQDKDDLTTRLRYVEVIEQIRAIRKSRSGIHLLPDLKSEAFKLRALSNIGHDNETFERLKSEVPRMREALAELEKKELEEMPQTKSEEV